jgi:heptaprenylglyceryl phosphate synthase
LGNDFIVVGGSSMIQANLIQNIDGIHKIWVVILLIANEKKKISKPKL